jgi:hypothetical protein
MEFDSWICIAVGPARDILFHGERAGNADAFTNPRGCVVPIVRKCRSEINTLKSALQLRPSWQSGTPAPTVASAFTVLYSLSLTKILEMLCRT